ncbi:MAG: LacI family DNA-binding transcriptional regulator [Kiritimatiellae bacterium]|jgi:LacI family transcriptional regulator|nr:LacI family DNA-binding transcriptional regulator [Kiritimatiellia bacterium]
MESISQRQIAKELGVSVATVSRALHQDPSVHPDTARRVMEALRRHGYQLDPEVSSSMTKVRRKSFYRETIAWCTDRPQEEMYWLDELFDSANEFAIRNGYRIQPFHFSDTRPRTLRRLADIWSAQGIRGVLVGPMHDLYEDLSLPWNSPRFCWVTIGATFVHPDLHNVGRDYLTDIRLGLEWLESKGCIRPCFLVDPMNGGFFKPFLLQAALVHHHRKNQGKGDPPFILLNRDRPDHLGKWLNRHRPNGLVLSGELSAFWRKNAPELENLPRVLLSPSDKEPDVDTFHNTAKYQVIGQVAVNMLHRLLRNRVVGIPSYRQSVLISSNHFTVMERPLTM